MLQPCYIELRKSNSRGSSSVVTDTMRHLHTRQHLGKAVIVSDDPAISLSAARKQWLKLSRWLQKQRAATLSADKILKYTHTITRMQHMRFTVKSPVEQPDADVYFLTAANLAVIPAPCWTVYATCDLTRQQKVMMTGQLPGEALVVDYLLSTEWRELGLRPKKRLEKGVVTAWQQVDQFLAGHGIKTEILLSGDRAHNVEAMDDALDTLLGGYATKFLQVASEFQRALELARPLRLNKDTRAMYDMLVLLAHRVQALTPGAFARQFLEVYDENDTFFLYDPARTRKHLVGSESLTEAFDRHTKAGRHHLARSLQNIANATP